MIKSLFIGLFTQKLIVVFVVVMVLVSLPYKAHAGFISFVSDLFHNTAAEAETTPAQNSQNMSLLHAAVNSDPNPSKGSGDIAIVGGSALLPETGPSGTMADVQQEDHTSTQISVYVVREGDSLGKIAELFGVSTNTILWANDLPLGSSIKPGETLVILPVSGIKYSVKSGDTIESLAKKYTGSSKNSKEILSYNGLKEGADLEVGSELIIPDGEQAALPQSTGHKSGGHGINSKLHNAGGPYLPGYYMRPIEGGRKTQGLHGYNGVDLASVPNTPIMAAADGEVIVSKTGGWNTGYGNYIVISHPNGTQTLYAHLNETLVSVGQSVSKGQRIALMGSTGNSTGTHLHFEIRGAANPF